MNNEERYYELEDLSNELDKIIGNTIIKEYKEDLLEIKIKVDEEKDSLEENMQELNNEEKTYMNNEYERSV